MTLFWVSLVAQRVKNLPSMQETWVQSPGWEDPLEKEMATHSSTLTVEENNRMEKTRDLFKKTRDTKGTFHGKMDSIKDRNGMDLTEAEDIKTRWQEYTEKLYKKDLTTQIITMV